MSTLRLAIDGMTCASCASRAERALARLPGVESAFVNLADETAELRGAASAAEAGEALRRAGYTLREETRELAIAGMTCAACAARVERALARAPGVLEAAVNPATDLATLRVAAGTDTAALVAAVERAGFGVADARAEEGSGRAARRAEDLRLAAAALLALPFLAGMVGMALGRDWMPGPWWQLALAAPVQFVLGARFYRAGWAALRAGAGNMDLLVALGTSAAFGLSLWSLLRPLESGLGGAHHHLYFEASVVLIFFVLLGKRLEAGAKREAGRAVRALLELRPRTAVRLEPDGSEREIAAALLRAGERFVVRPGGRVAADAVVVEGAALLDESHLTGESRPAERGPGDAVPAGAIPLDGRLVLRATAVGAETTLARVAELVRRAQAGRAPVQRLVDRVSAALVPVVVALALLTLLGWWLLAGAGIEEAAMHAVAVLVIACPCALGLATPAAILAGTGAAARAGILFRDLDAMERARRIGLVAFDKTGTLTEGRPRLAALHALAMPKPEALRLAAALQQASEHPLARAVLAAHSGPVPPVEGFRALPGLGVRGSVEGLALALGSPRLLGAGADRRPEAREEASRGHTLAWLVEEGTRKPLALFAFADAERAGAKEAVATLRHAGLRVAMLSGDSPEAAGAAAGRIGVKEVAAGVPPEGKAARIGAWQREGLAVAMVGDGVNDAPALAASDLGIAMAGGTEAATEAAAVALLRPDPRLVPAALDIARRTTTAIRQNLGWAFFYNAVGIPIVALGYLSPVLAGGAMALSSLSVVANALRLSQWRPDPFTTPSSLMQKNTLTPKQEGFT